MKKKITTALFLISVAIFMSCSSTKNSETLTSQKAKNSIEKEATQSNSEKNM